MKKAFLLVILAIFYGTATLVYTQPPKIEVSASSSDTDHESACRHGINSLKVAMVRKKLFDQQILLSTAAGRGEEAAAIGSSVAELNALITIFKKLVADPKLNCAKYLTENDSTIIIVR